MGSAHERGRSEEPFGVVGRRVGFQVCLLSSAPAGLATDRLEGRGRGHHRMQCQEGSSSRGGAVPRSAAAPGFPTAAGSRAQELPEVSELERTCARSPCLGESQGRQGHQCQGRCQAACLLRPLTRSENPLNQVAIRMPQSRPAPSPPPGRGRLQASSLLRPHPAFHPH